jgi:hypothetical protein
MNRLFQANVDVAVTFRNQNKLPTCVLPGGDDDPKELFLFGKDDPVEGEVCIKPNAGSKLAYTSIKVELIGQIELSYDRGNHYVFCSMHQEMASAGELREATTYPFSFAKAEKQFESYIGINVKLRYFIRVKIGRSYAPNVKREFDFAVQCLTSTPEDNPTLKMEVGIEDCLHIEFEYDKSVYALDECIRGVINFLLVRIKIQKMELQIIKRESTGSGPNLYNETEIVTKYEIMDGAPVKDEVIPIRLYLKSFNLSPTYRTVQSKFSVRYYLNLVLVDEEERRYFKQQEITLWRDKLVSAETKK